MLFFARPIFRLTLLSFHQRRALIFAYKGVFCLIDSRYAIRRNRFADIYSYERVILNLTPRPQFTSSSPSTPAPQFLSSPRRAHSTPPSIKLKLASLSRLLLMPIACQKLLWFFLSVFKSFGYDIPVITGLFATYWSASIATMQRNFFLILEILKKFDLLIKCRCVFGTFFFSFRSSLV